MLRINYEEIHQLNFVNIILNNTVTLHVSQFNYIYVNRSVLSQCFDFLAVATWQSVLECTFSFSAHFFRFSAITRNSFVALAVRVQATSNSPWATLTLPCLIASPSLLSASESNTSADFKMLCCSFSVESSAISCFLIYSWTFLCAVCLINRSCSLTISSSACFCASSDFRLISNSSCRLFSSASLYLLCARRVLWSNVDWLIDWLIDCFTAQQRRKAISAKKRC